MYSCNLHSTRYRFDDLREVLAVASPERSGDILAGVAADDPVHRMAARYALADIPLQDFLERPIIPYEDDEVTRLLLDSHDASAFAGIKHLTVGGLRNWLLDSATDAESLSMVARGLSPEMVAAASKLMRNQDLIAVARKCRVITRFRSTMGLPGRMAVRIQPNHPTDAPGGIAASIVDGILLGCGDAMIGINPASDNLEAIQRLLDLVDRFRTAAKIPTQGCVLTHVTNSIELIGRGAPVDLTFQSIAGSEAANRSFGINLALLSEARDATLSLRRCPEGGQVMYFETGQGAALSADAHHGVDQQTIETRAYGVARAFDPFLVNTVVGFIGPEYLYNGKQIARAALEDHCCGKLLGLPMGVDICYTNHAEADQDDMDSILTLLVAAGVTFIMGVPGSDDIMLNYQSTSYHDAMYAREVLGVRPAPEFEAWLDNQLLCDERGRIQQQNSTHGTALIDLAHDI